MYVSVYACTYVAICCPHVYRVCTIYADHSCNKSDQLIAGILLRATHCSLTDPKCKGSIVHVVNLLYLHVYECMYIVHVSLCSVHIFIVHVCWYITHISL